MRNRRPLLLPPMSCQDMLSEVSEAHALPLKISLKSQVHIGEPYTSLYASHTRMQESTGYHIPCPGDGVTGHCVVSCHVSAGT